MTVMITTASRSPAERKRLKAIVAPAVKKYDSKFPIFEDDPDAEFSWIDPDDE
ncbi:MAG: hypothetical protein H0U53_00210 [Actinobacteria bacterium]|nr:hypothetical protein [Actinomycetota bacterium]